MKPFSAWMYITRNRGRAAALTLVMAFVTVCFISGMYVDNPLQTMELIFDKPSDYMLLCPGSANTEIKEEFSKLADSVEEYLPECADTVLPVFPSGTSFRNLMGFESGKDSLIFRSVEDFEEFRRVTHCIPDDITLGDGQIVLSRTLANNWGVTIGDVLENDDDWNKASFFYQPMTVAAIVDIPGIEMYGVGEQHPGSVILVLRGEPSSVAGYEADTVDQALSDMGERIVADYPHVRVYDNRIAMADMREQLAMMSYILGGITVLVGFALAVTANAIFAASYDKRKYEFAVYKAMGFTGRQIFGKIASEVLLLNAIGLTCGMAVCTAVILVLNYILYPSGVGFVRVSGGGLIATAVCDLMVVIPVLFLNWRRTRRYDVTAW